MHTVRSPVDMALGLHSPHLRLRTLAPAVPRGLPAAHTALNGCLPSSSTNYNCSHRFLYEMLRHQRQPARYMPGAFCAGEPRVCEVSGELRNPPRRRPSGETESHRHQAGRSRWVVRVSRISDESSVSSSHPGSACSPRGGSTTLSPCPPLLQRGHVQGMGTPAPAQPPTTGYLPEARQEPPGSRQER